MTSIKASLTALPVILAAAGLVTAARAETTMVQIPTVNAALTVTRAGTGAGTVISNVGIINCGMTCSDTYVTGTSITLTATPDGSSQFTGWLGPCTGTGTCQFTINGTTTAVATFAPTVLGAPTLDTDGTTSYASLTDGLLILRYLFGVRGTELINGAVAMGAPRATAALI